MAKHEVTRDRAVALFMAMGFKTCDDWDDPKLLDRLGKVTEIVPDDFDPDPDLAELCLGLMKAAEKKDVIVLVDEPESEATDDPEPEADKEPEPNPGPGAVFKPGEDPEPDREPRAEVVDDKPKKDKPKKDKPKKDKPKVAKKRVKVMGKYSAGPFVRWLGSQGVDFDGACGVLDGEQCRILKDTSIKMELKEKREGKGPATVSDKDAVALRKKYMDRFPKV